jgi:hypothetical protein
LTALLVLAPLVGGCPIPERELLFPSALPDVPGVVHLGVLEPFDPIDPDAIADNVRYHEVGPTGTTQFGGVTFDFNGTGGDICVWIDPELASWSQSVAPASPVEQWAFPDNIFDDGDLDLEGGLSVYYSGVPGESIGGFAVDYRDALGNVVPIDLVECFITARRLESTPAHAGRGTPEYCTIANTIENVSYTVLMETFSTPIDDDRLAYGLVLSNGSCEVLLQAAAVPPQSDAEECLILGEGIEPGNAQGSRAAEEGLPAPSWIGDEVPSWGGSIAFEEAFCNGQLSAYCDDERRRQRDGELTCSWERQADVDDNGDRCFCGNLADTPRAGAD